MNKETFEFTKRKIRAEQRFALKRFGITAMAAAAGAAVVMLVNGDPFVASFLATLFGLLGWYASDM